MELISVFMWAVPLNTFVILSNLLGIFGLSLSSMSWESQFKDVMRIT